MSYNNKHSQHTLLEGMVLFRTRNGSIPRFIYGTPKWFYIEPFFFGKRLEPFKVLYRTFSSKSVLTVGEVTLKSSVCLLLVTS